MRRRSLKSNLVNVKSNSAAVGCQPSILLLSNGIIHLSRGFESEMGRRDLMDVKDHL